MLSLSFTSPDASIWRYIVSSASKFVETGLMILKPEELIIKAMDPSRTALIEFIIPKESFEEYNVSEERTVQLNFEELGKVLRSAEKDDRLSVKLEVASVKVSFERRGIVRTFTLPLHVEASLEEIPELSIEYVNRFKVRGEVFYDALSSIEDVGDVLVISGDKNVLKLSSVSDLGEAEVELSLDKGILEEAEVGSPGFTSSYTMEFFTYVKRPIKAAEYAILRADTGLPAFLELTYPQGSKLRYYVAPRT